jgi:hypothetical protein
LQECVGLRLCRPVHGGDFTRTGRCGH